MKKFETLKQLKEAAKLYMLPGKYNEELNEQLHMSIDMIGREYSSSRLEELRQFKNKIYDMEFDLEKENELLSKIYKAIKNQYQADMKAAQADENSDKLMDTILDM